MPPKGVPQLPEGEAGIRVELMYSGSASGPVVNKKDRQGVVKRDLSGALPLSYAPR